MADKRYALDMDGGEWREYLEKALGEPKFRADQITQWLWQKHADDPAEMTNLSLALREKLAEKVDFSYPTLVREQRSSDGTRKFLWGLRDGEKVESVLMKQGDRLTACISTQVGCPLQCTFCATGLSGYVRNLSAGEIAGQVLAIEKKAGAEVSNVVYMGMGEPFLNTENVLRSVRMLNSEKLRNLGIRHMTISTSGIIPGIEALADSGLGVRLAVSLHAADDELRSFLMPVNHSYPTDLLRRAMQAYQQKTGDRITIEYALFGGVNDSVERARELVRYLKGIHVFVNLIPFNSVDGRYKRPAAEDVLRFKSVLQTAGFECEIRAEQGADIDAACGQLRRKTAEGEAAPLESSAYSVTKADMEGERRHAPKRPEEAKRAQRGREGGEKERRFSSEPRGEGGRRTPSRPTGGFVEARGKRRRDDRPVQDRYRSGKMKEARPSWRAQPEAEGGEERRDFAARDERRFSNDRSNKPYGSRNAKSPGNFSDGRGDSQRRGPARGKFGEKGAQKPYGTRNAQSPANFRDQDEERGSSSFQKRGRAQTDGAKKSFGGGRGEQRPAQGKAPRKGAKPAGQGGAFSSFYGSKKRDKRGK